MQQANTCKPASGPTRAALPSICSSVDARRHTVQQHAVHNAGRGTHPAVGCKRSTVAYNMSWNELLTLIAAPATGVEYRLISPWLILVNRTSSDTYNTLHATTTLLFYASTEAQNSDGHDTHNLLYTTSHYHHVSPILLSAFSISQSHLSDTHQYWNRETVNTANNLLTSDKTWISRWAILTEEIRTASSSFLHLFTLRQHWTRLRNILVGGALQWYSNCNYNWTTALTVHKCTFYKF